MESILENEQLKEQFTSPTRDALVLMRLYKNEMGRLANEMTPFNVFCELMDQGHIKMDITLTESGEKIATDALKLWPRYTKSTHMGRIPF